MRFITSFCAIKRVVMASESVVNRLKLRADKADEIIAQLKKQLADVKQIAVKEEQARLEADNVKLKKEVQILLDNLVAAETKNGVKQIPIPGQSKTAKCVKASTPTENNVAKENKVAENENNDKPVMAKPKREKKPKEQNSRKGAAQEPEKPVDVSRLDMRVGKIVNVKRHPDADTLYVEDVDLGEERRRTIVSGLVNNVPIEEMQDRMAIFMCNLKPAKMRGILSEGMIMCASSPEKVEVLEIPNTCQIGDRVKFEGYPGEPDAQLPPKKKIWEQVAPDLKVDANGVATYKGVPFDVQGHGTAKAPSLKNVQIK